MLHKTGALNSAQNRLLRNSCTSSFTSSSSVLYIYMCVCESTEREYRKGALSGKTLLEFVFVRVQCDVTEKIRKKYRSNKERKVLFCVSLSPKRSKRSVWCLSPLIGKHFVLRVTFGCFWWVFRELFLPLKPLLFPNVQRIHTHYILTHRARVPFL